jgi:hypothetical protein
MEFSSLKLSCVMHFSALMSGVAFETERQARRISFHFKI